MKLVAAVVVLSSCQPAGSEKGSPDARPASTGDGAVVSADDAAVPGCNGSGTLDPSFGSGGVVRLFTSYIGNPTGSGGALNIDAVGRIIVVGEQLHNALIMQGLPVYRSCAIARLTSSGQLDPSFGGGNIVLESIDGYPCRYQSVALQSDGKIVVAGKIHHYIEPRVIVARYLDDGRLDPSFGDAGVVLSPPVSSATRLVVDDAGRIVVAGVISPVEDDVLGSWYVRRYLGDGTADPSFGTSGVAVPFMGSAYGVAWGLALDANGTIVVAGSAGPAFDGPSRVALARYDSSGAKDPSFGVEGEVSIPVGDDVIATSVIIDSTGRIVVAGVRDSGSDDGAEGVLLRLTAAGQLDPSFGTDGVIVERRGPPLIYGEVASDLAGNVLAFGYENDPTTHSQAVLVRHTDAGMRDPSFGIAGFAVPLPLSGLRQVVRSLVVQPDGRVLVSGTFYSNQVAFSDIYIARYCP
jgi:uncharacterized delta-60 repeat protein